MIAFINMSSIQLYLSGTHSQLISQIRFKKLIHEVVVLSINVNVVVEVIQILKLADDFQKDASWKAKAKINCSHTQTESAKCILKNI